jgi:bifunctional non-homologous end joining protein LigD
VDGFGKAFYELVRGAGLEGMVAKRRRSVYAGGVTGEWLKVKCIRTHEFVVGGWIAAPGSSRRIAGLLLGEFVDGALRYVGKVDSGFDAKSLRAIGDALEMQVASPFQETVCEPDVVFCAPDFRVPVEFVDFTEAGFLRRPVFSRFALFRVP